MAVCRGCFGREEVVEFVGCTLGTYEHNGSWDSDWYAVVWNEAEGKIEKILYDTTRAAADGSWAKADATDEVKRKVYRYLWNNERARFDTVYRIAEAKKIRKGDTVRVFRGRKVPKGTVGKVFWTGVSFNPYRRVEENRIGIEVDGEKKFLPEEYAESIGWEKRIVTGRKRKEAIRRNTLRSVENVAMMSAREFLDGKFS